MPDGGAGEVAVAEVLMEEGAAETIAAGAADAAMTGGVESGVAATFAADAVAGASADAAMTGGVSGAVNEVAGAGPAAITGDAATSQTDKLAQSILNPGTAETPAAAVTDVPTDKILDPRAGEVVKPAGDKGIIDGMVGWADKHPMAATIAGTQIAGAVGGVGKAALEKEIAERNIRARSDLLTQQSQTALQQSRAGALPGGGVNIKPKPGPLRRPDGSLVFQPGSGIVNSNITQGG